MMPKKSPEERRSHIIGVKVDEETKSKLKFLADIEDQKMSTYIYNLLIRHIKDKEPFLTKEMKHLKNEKGE